jgi:uncharacterized protein (UPF0333 family)
MATLEIALLIFIVVVVVVSGVGFYIFNKNEEEK